MGFYGDRILPRITDRFMAGDQFGPHRRDCLADVSGDVLEIGFGSGLNLPYYPSDVRKLYALDPAKLGRGVLMVTCPLCMAEFDPHKENCHTSCAFNKSCSMIQCPMPGRFLVGKSSSTADS